VDVDLDLDNGGDNDGIVKLTFDPLKGSFSTVGISEHCTPHPGT
jgi:hypothetical protein